MISKIGSEFNISPSKLSEIKKPEKPVEALKTEDFLSYLKGSIEDVNQQISEADQLTKKLALGEKVDIHDVMLSMEKAEIAYKMLNAVRSKMLSAYQDVMKMNI